VAGSKGREDGHGLIWQQPLQTLCFGLCIQRRQVDAAVFGTAGCVPLKNEMPRVRQQRWHSVVNLLARAINSCHGRGDAASGDLGNAACAAKNDSVVEGPEASKDKDRHVAKSLRRSARNSDLLELASVQNTMYRLSGDQNGTPSIPSVPMRRCDWITNYMSMARMLLPSSKPCMVAM
jgi:hypothetical protein